MDAHLLLEADTAHAIAHAGIAGLVEKEFRDEEKRDAFRAGRGVRQAGKDEMDDVLSHVVIAPGDEYLLAGNRIATVCIRDRSGLERADITASLGLGEVHRAGPLTGHEFRQIGSALGIGPVGEQRLDGAEREHRAEAKRHICTMEHLHHAEGERFRQSLPAPVLGRGKAHPTAFNERFIGFGKTWRGNNALLRQD